MTARQPNPRPPRVRNRSAGPTQSTEPPAHSGGRTAPGARNLTADRAIDVLFLFDDGHLVLSAVEIARRLGLSRPTTYRYLQSLRDRGLLEEDPAARGFRLGTRIFQLARLARKGLGLSELALPIMRTLAAETGETVMLRRLSGGQMVCVERVDSPHPARLAYERGDVLPLLRGAGAKVVLAHLEPTVLDGVLAAARQQAAGDDSLPDLDALRAELAAIRQAGYAVSAGDMEAGVLGVSAPILDSRGYAAASLTVVALAFRVEQHTVPRLIEAVRVAADAIGQRLREVEA